MNDPVPARDHDHHRLGRALGLYGTDPLLGAGLPYLLPDGASVRHALEEYVRGLEVADGYQHVHSPVLGKQELYVRSGHWAHYRADMFPPMEVGGEHFVLRPSLCPHHALIYRAQARSYRELPLRIAELGGMFRAEPSGTLGGLTRVRAIHLNDAHLFCAPESLAGEVAGALALIRTAYRALGLAPSRYRLSLPGEGAKYALAEGVGERSAAALAEALAGAGLDWEEERGEAAFYGPKIDVQARDAAGREFTLSTVQADFHQPAAFGLDYRAADGSRPRPVMVHRSVLGSLERVLARLIEVHGGAFPAWLAPVQVGVVPVGEEQEEAAESFVRRCRAAGLRARRYPAHAGTLAARVRQARLVPHLAVLGAREAAAGEVALRRRDGERLPARPEAEAVALLVAGSGVPR
ncbi:aminoacyl--tRNA ligase-related protein [Streptomyces sp. AM 3-1-1]|uniref:aminoacyl--tRNA ligase-related protein n=1 Tax=Streptomyces sp. AM 3-1-1 TaxID=3028711 RepID=UPI0023B9AE75|nr:aminoacyl--tRNA ligase-related protein [Streptomyces sp. AM 3-1-1]WEH26647.1 His/Gly/Thr/Pro-type tRNA ligase C-terminal domain-containing protein [Streptomyces sp. AM 3-1-1]